MSGQEERGRRLSSETHLSDTHEIPGVPPHAVGFRSQREEVAGVELAVEGSFPAWLTGDYYVNGPGAFELGATDAEHWFDGLAMLRRFRIDGPESVGYTNRFVRSRDYKYARQTGGARTAFPGLAPDGPPWRRLYQLLAGEFTDNTTIGFVRVDGHLVAITESPHGFVIDPETLGVKRRIDLTAGIDADITLGHPHYDSASRELVNLGVSFVGDPSLTLFRRPDGESRCEPITRLEFTEPPYVHSFAITSQYAVITDMPFGVDPSRLLTETLRGGTFIDAFEAWDRPTRFHIIDRTTGRVVATPEADPFVVFHHANAYEQGDELVVDLIAYPDADAITNLRLDTLRDRDPPIPDGDLRRYRLPLDGGEASGETLYEGPIEFPTIPYDRSVGSRYRDLYCAGTDTTSGSSLPTHLLKLDMSERPSGSRDAAWGTGRTAVYPGEPAVVPGPADESDVVLSLVLDAEADRSMLICLDTDGLEERARALLPHALPYPFHGQFYADGNPTRTMA